ncbi:MetQ/NlpA family ABC transporter substrate-binding protein [Microbacterium sp. Clip185]|uniref:MetQ/NlpA family ABC transporter substrate-binding protein n=1 Tax=Microbacterium sp. Clip185 TaxID=3025663 RepID=UPI0023663685|nr:MetQ/NlpA family ABC transporter substrate-binding protein [Microbacterium sp. Clip185]WDG18683.1 MetQ/NlpA family ABC transporter substrate-binding protein [Microbacterium sp. Clip185]
MSEKSPESPDLRTALDASRRRRRTTWLSVAAVAVVAVIVGVVAIVANLTRSEEPAAAAAGTERAALRIAVSEDNDFQAAVADIASEKGLDVTWVNVDDWVLPNTELAAGTVDGNAFQHILYLSNFNAQNGEDLTPVFSTLITQWGIFSATLGDTDEIPDGGRIAIPDDPSNGGRALGILASAGLIELSEDAGDFPSVDDVTANPKNLEFVPIAATTIPQQFDDPSLSAVVVGLSYFDPSQGITADKALYLDDSLDEKNLPYINVVASRADNADDPAWKILEEAYADPRAAAALEKEDKGATVLVQVPVETLRTKLADLEKSAAANG